MAPQLAHQAMDWVTQRNRKDRVVALMQAGDWRAVIKEFHGKDKYREPLLVWIRPSLTCLEFIRTEVSLHGVDQMSSVGCGCGTLEWLIQQATGE